MIATAADGTRLHYIVEGTGPPLVLVGGRTSTIEGAWWRYTPALSARFTVIALDNRGTGGSGRPDTPYSTSLMAEDALTVLRDAGEPSAHWFGLSMGGMILQQLALTHPAAVRSLILGATHCGGERPATADAPTAEGPLRRYANLYDARFISEHPEWVQEDATHFGKMPLHAIVRQDQAVKQHNRSARRCWNTLRCMMPTKSSAASCQPVFGPPPARRTSAALRASWCSMISLIRPR